MFSNSTKALIFKADIAFGAKAHFLNRKNAGKGGISNDKRYCAGRDIPVDHRHDSADRVSLSYGTVVQAVSSRQ
jgi:hypothetical protein